MKVLLTCVGLLGGSVVLGANPVIMDAADPHAMIEGGKVYVYPTHGQFENKFYVFSSSDFETWERYGPILDFSEIGWMPENKRPWAPGIIERDGNYYFYYSAGPKPSFIGVAVGSSPVGPFKDSGKAIVKDAPSFEAIDPMVFEDPKSGSFFMYAGGSAGATLRVFELNDDMVNFAREIEVETPERFTEGAFMHHRDGIYYLSYSHGRYDRDSYSVHYATAVSPLGPWTYRGAILESDARFKGPGHHSFVQNPVDGTWYVFYHRWENVKGKGRYKNNNPKTRRKTAIEVVQYDEEGMILPIKMTNRGVGTVRLK
ncbi:MAG: family 43 glycosylhydrolase [Kiritimatiellales bacterium]|nr:family 43 glycosylhydrolase [Kiritimatiellales bacterium]